MGKKLDALLGRSFKPYKFKALINLAISRLAVLKNQRQARCVQARSDVVQLLELGNHETAFFRIDHVIKEQNMLDVLVMLESYCNLLTERIYLIEQERVCPTELREAISGLIYASSRCGDFPELQEIRVVFASRFGKEFAASAIDLRNNCGVSPKMIQKLSTRQSGWDNRMEVLKKIAAEHNITLKLEEPTKETSDVKTEPNPLLSEPSTHSGVLPKEMETDDGYPDSMRGRKKFKDVADAAQAAFESAAYAAAAARAAVELSRSDSHDPDDFSGPSTQGGKLTDIHKSTNVEPESQNKDIHNEKKDEEPNKSDTTEDLKRLTSDSSSNSTEDIVMVTATMSMEVDHVKLLEKDLVFNDSDNETENEKDSSENVSSVNTDFSEQRGVTLNHPSSKQSPIKFKAGLKEDTKTTHPTAHAEGSGIRSTLRGNIEKASIWTRQVRGY